jgi:hypothetical protein
MGRTLRIVMIASLACWGCNRQRPEADRPTAIWYSHAGCYGWCPRFEIRVSSDGRGVFEGHNYTAVKGKRSFRVSPKQYYSFFSALRGARQLAKPFDRSKNAFDQINRDFQCPPDESYHTDDTGVFIMWSDHSGDSYYDVDYGCDSDRKKKLYDALDKAPNELGLAAMIGKPGPTTKR